MMVRLLACLILGLLVADVTAQTRAIRITATQPTRTSVEQTEWSVGLIETRSSSQVAAEVAGEVVAVMADEGQGVEVGAVLAEIDASQYKLDRTGDQAEVRRLSALLRKQERELERARKLKAENLIAEDELDGIAADLDALRQELVGAQSRMDSTDRRLGKTRLVAPVKGEVVSRSVDVGDYLQTGTIAFDLIDMEKLRVRLPFPEYRAPQLATGLAVRLQSVAAGAGVVSAAVTDIRPSVDPSNRSVILIVDFDNPGNWRPGASVRAELVMQVRENALLVPQVSVVRRPAGDVVYVIRDGIATQQIVTRGERQKRFVEIVEGLTGEETIAVDGAGFLADGARVELAGS
ncbi:MAG: efflux RND transporter periplasmic adaptor subunit [Gammaproteobacteria bacterium]